jgi:hypothetical protein
MSDNNQRKYIIGGVIFAVVVVVIIVIVVSTSSSSSKSSSPGSPGIITPLSSLVKTVSLERPSAGDPINLSEIMMYDERNIVIPASNMTANLNPPLDGYPASNMIDGDLNNFAHTTDNVASSPIQYIRVVLNNPMKISKIVIKNRVDCCRERISGLAVKTLTDSNVELSSKVLTGSSLTYELTYNADSGANLGVTSSG